MTANRGRGTYAYESIVSEVGFAKGNHYWEVTLDCFGTEEDIFIGVCKDHFKVDRHGCETPNMAWGWQCTSSRKMGPSSESGRMIA